MTSTQFLLHSSRQFFEVVGAQRACREFSIRDVSDQEISQVLVAATHAPSAMNHQPWVFVVVRDSEARQALVTVMRELWEGAGRAATEGLVPAVLLEEVDRGFTKTLQDAPVLIVVAGDTTMAPAEQLPWSVYPAVQNLLLAATALGLGSALTTMATFRAADVQAIVGLPEELIPMAIVPIGWPAHTQGKPRRIPIEQKVSRERFGRAW
jgi:nitroreductase